MPDLAGGTDQVGVIQLRRDIVFVGLGEEPAETQGLFEERQGDIERRLPFFNPKRNLPATLNSGSIDRGLDLAETGLFAIVAAMSGFVRFDELGAFLKANVAAGSHLLTDGFAAYRGRDATAVVQHRVEHRREVTGRGIDDLQHLGGRGLLLQGLARLGQEPRILHRDDRLRREVLQQCDLLVSKRPHLLAERGDDAEQRAVFPQRNHQHRSNRVGLEGALNWPITLADNSEQLRWHLAFPEPSRGTVAWSRCVSEAPKTLAANLSFLTAKVEAASTELE